MVPAAAKGSAAGRGQQNGNDLILADSTFGGLKQTKLVRERRQGIIDLC